MQHHPVPAHLRSAPVDEGDETHQSRDAVPRFAAVATRRFATTVVSSCDRLQALGRYAWCFRPAPAAPRPPVPDPRVTSAPPPLRSESTEKLLLPDALPCSLLLSQ